MAKKKAPVVEETTIETDVNLTDEELFADLGDLDDDLPVIPDLFAEEDEKKEEVKPVAEKPVVVKRVKLVSDEELGEIKNRVVFRMGEGTNDKYSFSKVCNISMQEKNTILVILYLNEHDVDRAQETASFAECKKEEFLAEVKGILVDMSLIESYKVSCKYFVRGEHFGKIVVSLAK